LHQPEFYLDEKMTNTYPEPISKLLKLGRPLEPWQDYAALGILPSDIPELIRLVEDHELRIMEPPDDFPDNEELPEWFAQVHAWRALAQLKAEEAVPAILGILYQVDEDDDDWIGEDAEDIFAAIGPAAIPALGDYLANENNGLFARAAAASSLRNMAIAHPETREECLNHLAGVLEKYAGNDEGLNGFLIYDLVQLKAVEKIDLIEKAFASKNVDEFIMGDFEDVQIELGLIEKRTKLRPRPDWFDDSSREKEMFQPERNVKKTEKKDKNKRKQEKKSRQKNRKRK
jgi:hypothetical protein